MLPLCRQRTVFGDDSPAVGHFADVATPGVDHGLDGEGHAFAQHFSRARLAVVQHLRVFVEVAADAMAAEFAHDAVARALGEGLDDVADVAQPRTRFDQRDAMPHGLEGDVNQPLHMLGYGADTEHAAAVAVESVLDDGDVDVDHIAALQRFVVRNAVADDIVDRGADRRGVGRVARRRVI